MPASKSKRAGGSISRALFLFSESVSFAKDEFSGYSINMDQDKLTKEFETYRKLGEKDKNIDVASLMLNAMDKTHDNLLPIKQKRWAYLVSIGFPPFGLLFALKFYFSGKDDGQENALLCVVLTAVSILLAVITVKLMLSGSGVDTSQIQQLDPKDIQELLN